MWQFRHLLDETTASDLSLDNYYDKNSAGESSTHIPVENDG